MGLSSKESESDDYKLREILRDDLGKIFVYDRIIQNIGGSVGGSVTAGNVAGSSSSHVGGNVSFAINELPSSSKPDKPGIKELLTQLQEAIEADPNLSDDDRNDALEQVKELAEAAQNPNDGGMKEKAKTANRMLGRIMKSVPQATQLLEFCNNLLPLITKAFGF